VLSLLLTAPFNQLARSSLATLFVYTFNLERYMFEIYTLNGHTVYPVSVPQDAKPMMARQFRDDGDVDWDKYMIVFVPGQGDQLVRKSKIKVRKRQ